MTLNSDQVLSIAAETRLFATVRMKSETEAQLAVQALVEGGVRLVEVTLTTPGALNVIADWRDHPDIIVGAGSILDVDMARQSLAAGARYLVSPHTELDVIRLGCEHGALVAAGAATPTEMMPTVSDTRPAWTMRDKRSRPNWSVPIKCSTLGG